MNTHYIPRLLLKPFAENNKVNTYDFKTEQFYTKKLKHTFSEENLYDEELETIFAKKLEGPFGNILNHKFLKGEKISIDRSENLLVRKFFMINALRSPMTKLDWDEMVKLTQTEEHRSIQLANFMKNYFPEYKKMFDSTRITEENYLLLLKKAMESESLEELAQEEDEKYMNLTMSSRMALATAYTIWDCEETGLEFISPKLQGISQMDQVGIFYKSMVIYNLIEEKKKTGMDELQERELQRLFWGSASYSDNFSIYPISPTRAIISFSPYFRAFFPMTHPITQKKLYEPFLNKEQFDRHFFAPARLELFQPCFNIMNSYYQYTVKKLTREETLSINALLLQTEPEEFVFHDYNKIRDSLWYYDFVAKLADKKKHNFRHLS